MHWRLALACLLATGCLHRAVELREADGTYTLVTTVSSVDQAMVRVERSAHHVCPGAYTVSDPKVTAAGYGATPWGPVSHVTIMVTLACH